MGLIVYKEGEVITNNEKVFSSLEKKDAVYFWLKENIDKLREKIDKVEKDGCESFLNLNSLEPIIAVVLEINHDKKVFTVAELYNKAIKNILGKSKNNLESSAIKLKVKKLKFDQIDCIVKLEKKEEK